MCLYINVDVLIPYVVCHVCKIIWRCVHVASSRTPHLRAVKPGHCSAFAWAVSWLPDTVCGFECRGFYLALAGCTVRWLGFALGLLPDISGLSILAPHQSTHQKPSVPSCCCKGPASVSCPLTCHHSCWPSQPAARSSSPPLLSPPPSSFSQQPKHELVEDQEEALVCCWTKKPLQTFALPPLPLLTQLLEEEGPSPLLLNKSSDILIS